MMLMLLVSIESGLGVMVLETFSATSSWLLRERTGHTGGQTVVFWFPVCSGFVRARQQVYLIEPLGQTEDGDHAVYRREHLKVSGRPSCGSSSNTSTPYDRDQGPRLASLFRSRSWVGHMMGDWKVLC